MVGTVIAVTLIKPREIRCGNEWKAPLDDTTCWAVGKKGRRELRILCKIMIAEVVIVEDVVFCLVKLG